MSNTQVRTRFAPSPTGHLHIGGARTALFNWLFTRKMGGNFILRIEDTDLKRSTEESIQEIISALRWLGLDWDEGPDIGGEFAPYRQSQRLDKYQAAAEKLLEKGSAYHCFCEGSRFTTKEELSRLAASGEKLCQCHELSTEQVQQKIEAGKVPAVRFRVDPARRIEFIDTLRGHVEFKPGTIEDFIILKSDRMNGYAIPTYNFGAVVDDVDMRITHVIRGDDHISNTPRQILLYEALEYPIPNFAHVPMILGEDGTRLSKRHGAASIQEFKEQGYIQQAMINFLVLLGWAYDDKQTLFTLDELIEKFELRRISSNPARLNLQKLDWMNQVYLKEMPADQRTRLAIPFLIKAGLFDERYAKEHFDYIVQVIQAIGDRLKRLTDAAPLGRFLFVEDIEYDEKALKKHLGSEDKRALLAELIHRLEKVEPFDMATIERIIKDFIKEKGIGMGKAIQPLRVALTGSAVSFGIYEILTLLGRERMEKRVKKLLDKIGFET